MIRMKQRHGPAAWMRAGFRMMAALLALLMCLQAVVVSSAADETDGGLTEDEEPEAIRPENTYMLVVSTGICAGTSVQYFGIRFEDERGIQRTEFIFPHDASLKKGYETAKSVSSPEARLEQVYNATGYRPSDDFGGRDGLTAYSYDMYMFETRYAIKRLIDFDVFFMHVDVDLGSQGDSSELLKNEWTCNDIRLYKVNALYGVNMSGYYSSDFFIDFEGELMAAFKKKTLNGGDFSINLTDKTFSLIRGNSYTRTMETSFDEDDPRVSYATKDYLTQLWVRLDLADIYGGGIEALSNEYNDKKALLPDMQLCEALTVHIDYKDVFNMQRRLAIPAISSYAAYAMAMTGDLKTDPVIGLAQQGDTLAFPVTVPDYGALNGYTVAYGYDSEDKAAVEFSPRSSSTEKGVSVNVVRYSERREALKSETVSLAGVSLYEGGNAKVVFSVDGAVLRCAVSGTPSYVYTAPSAQGIILENNQSRSLFNELRRPDPDEGEGTSLVPTVTDRKYVVEINTDIVNAANTTEELLFTYKYVGKDGMVKTSDTMSIRDLTNDFFGYWSNSNDSNVAYYAGTSLGGKLAFAITNNDIVSFKSVTLSVNADTVKDEWQMSSLTIYSPAAVSQRYATWMARDTRYGDTVTDRFITRMYSTDVVEQSIKKQVLLNNETRAVELTFDGSGGGSAEEIEYNWEKLSKSMTYNEASQDLGFTKRRCVYHITVQVASNADILGSDDAGSVNQFFFQLTFTNGKSGYICANQQLAADGFRAGMFETFDIATNRDYGDLCSVVIIPDDTLKDSVIHDKLKVEYITITKETDGSMNRSWGVTSVEWIGIDFTDDGMKETVIGQAPRSEAEMTRNYVINQKGYSVSFMFALTSGCFTSENHEDQFSGYMQATIYYMTGAGLKWVDVDVVAAIAEYAEKTPDYRTLTISNKAQRLAHSDKSYMFRPNHVDRFKVTLDDVRSIIAVEFHILTDKACTWEISGVDVYQVITNGTLVLNASGEYQRNGKIEYVCSNVEQEPIQKSMNANGFFDLSIDMQSNKININETEWEATVESSSFGENDVLNVYLWLAKDSQYADNVGLMANIKYQMRNSDRLYQIKASDFSLNSDDGILYVIQLSARGMTALRELTVTAKKSVKLDHAIVRQMRSDVVINSFYFDLQGMDAEKEIKAYPTADPTLSADIQEVELKLHGDSDAIPLNPGSKDLTVRIGYTSVTDEAGYVYSSPAASLTDQGVTVIREGSTITVQFSQHYIRDITSVTLKGSALNVTVDEVTVRSKRVVNENEVQLLGEYHSGQGIPITSSDTQIVLTAVAP